MSDTKAYMMIRHLVDGETEKPAHLLVVAKQDYDVLERELAAANERTRKLEQDLGEYVNGSNESLAAKLFEAKKRLRVLEGKWFDAECQDKGCQSLVHVQRAEAAERLAAENARDAERYRAMKWSYIFHVDADDDGTMAESFDAKTDEVVADYRIRKVDAARSEEGKR